METGGGGAIENGGQDGKIIFPQESGSESRGIQMNTGQGSVIRNNLKSSKLTPPPEHNTDSKESSSTSFDLLGNEEEEKLMGDAGPLPDHDLSRSRIDKASQPVQRHSNTAPSLRSISLPQGPRYVMSESETTPILPLKHAPSAGNVAPMAPMPEELGPGGDNVKKPKRNVSDYYKKQNELLESFKNDNEQIMVFQRTRTRQRLQSSTSIDPCEDKENQHHGQSNLNVAASNGNGLSLASLTNNDEAKAPLLKQDGPEDDLETYRHPSGSDHNGSTSAANNLGVAPDFSRSTESAERIVEKHEAAARKSADATRAAARLALATLLVNITLMFAKALASYLSGSLSILSSLADSIVDITSGLVIFVTTRAIKKRDPYQYPRGRTRLEPIALIIISTVMGIASIMLIMESVKRIVSQTVDLDVDWISAGIMVATIMTKFALFCICKRYKNEPSINVLAQDHRNDCLSNFVALVCAGLATILGERDPLWKYLDPAGAIIVSIYIAYTWMSTGREHMAMLSGKSAEPDFINRIIKVCIDHDPRIIAIDTVYVYHWGTRFLVEVHIVLDETFTLKVAHDISESLQINIESLPEVERAFVHTDYDFTHQPADEHKVV